MDLSCVKPVVGSKAIKVCFKRRIDQDESEFDDVIVKQNNLGNQYQTLDHEAEKSIQWYGRGHVFEGCY